MRIAHISDVHIRNLKRHDEYREVFENLYKQLRIMKPDLIINTGDTAHTKTNISPEFVQMTSEHIREVSDIAPYVILLGNHDLNLMNPDRQDALTPIVDSIGSHRVFLCKKSGKYRFLGHNFWVFSLADQDNYPTPEHWEIAKQSSPNDVNIGLFHGSVKGCVTDSDWVMDTAEHGIEMFSGLDFVMMGDIHKQQFFSNRRIAYAGSLVQQNFGEEQEKGFLLWDITDSKNFDVKSISVPGGRKFVTLNLSEQLDVIEKDVPRDARIRIVSPQGLTLVQQREIERKIKNDFLPYDIVSVTSHDLVYKRNRDTARGKIANVRELSSQENLISSYMKEEGVSDEELSEILALNRKFQVQVDKNDEHVRNVSWKIDKIRWNNMFNYGSDNVMDFSQIRGITGIFAPNTAGKSSVVEIILESLFDKVTKDISKNIELVNDNKTTASMNVDFSVGDERFFLERVIEKIKYGQRKLSETKEWGKTSLNLYRNTPEGRENLNGDLRPETERLLRSKIGSFDDFILTAVSAQNGNSDIINCKETERKKILFRFLDLDIFEQKASLARDEAKSITSFLKDFDNDSFIQERDKLKRLVDSIETEIEDVTLEISFLQSRKDRFDQQRIDLIKDKRPVNNVDIDSVISEKKAKQSSLADLENIRASLDEKLASYVQKRESLKKSIENYNEEELRGFFKKADSKNGELSFLNREIDLLESELKNSSKKLKILGEVPCGTQFLSCQFLKDANSASEKHPSLEGELLSKKADRTQVLKEISELMPLVASYDQLQAVKRDMEANQREIEKIELAIEKFRFKREELIGKIEQCEAKESLYAQSEKDILWNSEIESRVREISLEIEKLDRSVKERAQSVNDLNKRLGSHEGMLKKVDEQISEFEKMRKMSSAYEKYIGAMGRNGIPYQILAKNLPMINDEINKILAGIVDFSVFLEHDQEEQSVRLYMQYGEFKSRNLGLSSGAEKFISSLAIRSALLSVSSLPKSNMFIIDEGFGKLDPSHLESMQKMFDYLRSMFEHVIVISHVDYLKDMVDNSIDILTDREGYAHVEV